MKISDRLLRSIFLNSTDWFCLWERSNWSIWHQKPKFESSYSVLWKISIELCIILYFLPGKSWRDTVSSLVLYWEIHNSIVLYQKLSWVWLFCVVFLILAPKNSNLHVIEMVPHSLPLNVEFLLVRLHSYFKEQRKSYQDWGILVQGRRFPTELLKIIRSPNFKTYFWKCVSSS